MNEKTELLPCPFCGGTPRCVDMAGWEIHCDCGAQLWRARPDKDALVEHWNARIDFAASPSSKSTKELYAAIMNLPCRSPLSNVGFMTAYNQGHRDARHAAAELALASSSIKEDGGGGEQ